MKTNDIEITRSGRVISKHATGIVCVYDSRYRILKVPMEDGSIFELVQEQAYNGTIGADYRTKLMTIKRGNAILVVE
jgi:hypothetical protein